MCLFDPPTRHPRRDPDAGRLCRPPLVVNARTIENLAGGLVTGGEGLGCPKDEIPRDLGLRIRREGLVLFL